MLKMYYTVHVHEFLTHFLKNFEGPRYLFQPPPSSPSYAFCKLQVSSSLLYKVNVMYV